MKVYILIAMMIVSFNSSAVDHDDLIMFTGATFLSKILVDNGYSKGKAFSACLVAGVASEYAWKVAFNIKPSVKDLWPNLPGCYLGSSFKFNITRVNGVTIKQISYTWKF